MRSLCTLLDFLLQNRNDVITWIISVSYLFMFVGCGVNFTSSAGRIISPDYPNRYDDNLNCSYIIDQGPQTLVILEFETFHLEGNQFLIISVCTMKCSFLLENIQVFYRGKQLMV